MQEKIKTVGQIIGKFFLLLTIWIISIVIADSLSTTITSLGKPSSVFLFEFLPFLGLYFGHLILIRLFEKSGLSFIRVSMSNFFSKLLIGLFFGLFWLAIAVIPIYFLGKGQLTTVFSLNATQLSIYFFILFVNAAMQELLVHGYLFSLLQNKYSKVTALIVTSILFLLLHPGAINAGIIASINVFGAGLIFGLITIYFDSLFSATIAHSIWNYFGAVWFGLIPLDNYPSMKLISVTGNPLFIGDKNGMETSVTVTITIVLLITMILIRKTAGDNSLAKY
jgi:membrane protease YdiL (CAAX protease family)